MIRPLYRGPRASTGLLSGVINPDRLPRRSNLARRVPHLVHVPPPEKPLMWQGVSRQRQTPDALGGRRHGQLRLICTDASVPALPSPLSPQTAGPSCPIAVLDPAPPAPLFSKNGCGVRLREDRAPRSGRERWGHMAPYHETLAKPPLRETGGRISLARSPRLPPRLRPSRYLPRAGIAPAWLSGSGRGASPELVLDGASDLRPETQTVRRPEPPARGRLRRSPAGPSGNSLVSPCAHPILSPRRDCALHHRGGARSRRTRRGRGRRIVGRISDISGRRPTDSPQSHQGTRAESSPDGRANPCVRPATLPASSHAHLRRTQNGRHARARVHATRHGQLQNTRGADRLIFESHRACGWRRTGTNASARVEREKLLG